jgi:large subunit ribosomal protein L29
MKYQDIKELTDEELAKKLEDGRSELFNLRFQMATNQLDNTARVKSVKHDIARVQTEMRARQIAAEKTAAEK